MTMERFMDFEERMKEDGLVLFYRGYFSQDVLESLGEMLRKKMEIAEVGVTMAHKVFSVFVEQVHNIIHYSDEILASENDEHPAELPYGSISIGIENGRYTLVCSNRISDEGAAALKGKLDTLRDMDKPALKKYYRERIREDREEGSKGAGLGLLEIFKNASEPVHYEFNHLSPSHCKFFLKATV